MKSVKKLLNDIFMRGTQICDCKMDFKNRMQNSPLFSNLDYFAVMLKKKKIRQICCYVKNELEKLFYRNSLYTASEFLLCKTFRMACGTCRMCAHQHNHKVIFYFSLRLRNPPFVFEKWKARNVFIYHEKEKKIFGIKISGCKVNVEITVI